VNHRYQNKWHVTWRLQLCFYRLTNVLPLPNVFQSSKGSWFSSDILFYRFSCRSRCSYTTNGYNVTLCDTFRYTTSSATAEIACVGGHYAVSRLETEGWRNWKQTELKKLENTITNEDWDGYRYGVSYGCSKPKLLIKQAIRWKFDA